MCELFVRITMKLDRVKSVLCRIFYGYNWEGSQLVPTHESTGCHSTIKSIPRADHFDLFGHPGECGSQAWMVQ